MRLDDRKWLGTRCENLAAGYLHGKGYRIIRHNFRTRLGEMDLICAEGMVLVFVEVKARRGERYGSGSDAVDARKQARLMAIAQIYMANSPHQACRFDVIEVTWRPDRPHIRHFIHAFP